MLSACVKDKECTAGPQPDFTGNYNVQVTYHNTSTLDSTYVDTMNISCANCPYDVNITHFLYTIYTKKTKNFKTIRYIPKEETKKHFLFKKQPTKICSEGARYNTMNDDDYLILRNDSLIFTSRHSYKTYFESTIIKGKKIN